MNTPNEGELCKACGFKPGITKDDFSGYTKSGVRICPLCDNKWPIGLAEDSKRFPEGSIFRKPAPLETK
jgi:hypothetical protein